MHAILWGTKGEVIRGQLQIVSYLFDHQVHFEPKQDHQRVMVDPMLLIGLDCPDRFRLP